MSTVREECLALLRSRGITTIFGNPGSTELPMFRDSPTTSGPSLVDVEVP